MRAPGDEHAADRHARVAERRFQPGAVLASIVESSTLVDLVVSAGATRASDDGERYTQVFAADSLRVDLSEHVNAFAEAYAFNREAAGGDSHRCVAVGFVRPLDRDTALDARVGRGIRNGDGTAWFASFGIWRRFRSFRRVRRFGAAGSSRLRKTWC